MSRKKNKTEGTGGYWSSCDCCKVIIYHKDVLIHKEKSCPPDFENWIHSFIANSKLFSTCNIFHSHIYPTVGELKFTKEEINDYVFMPVEILQLCQIPLGDPVVMKFFSCKGSFQIMKLTLEYQRLSDAEFVFFSNDVADLYNINQKTHVVISKFDKKVLPAKLVRVVCESDIESLKKEDLLSLLHTQNLNKFYCKTNKILLRYYGNKIIFKIIEMTSFTKEDLEPDDFCLITVDTKWWLSKTEEKIPKPRNLIHKLGGLNSVIAKIKDTISLALSGQNTLSGIQITKGVLIYGPNGTGKTTLIEAMAEEFTNNVVRVEYSKLLSKMAGETEKELQNLFEIAQLMKPSVILIDDLDVLCGKSNLTFKFEKTIITTLCFLMDQLSRKPETPVVVLGTTSKIHKIDRMLRCPNRFGKEIEIHVPSTVQRFEILKSLMVDVDHKLDDLDLKNVSDSSHGFVGADLVSVVSKAVLKNYKRNEGKEKIDLSDVQWALSKVKPSAMREIMIDIPNVRWEDIGGLEDLKLKLKQCIDWPLKHSQAFTKLGIMPSKGVLMFGPPGCSKTMIAKAVATESKLNFISVKGPEIFSKWVGESERAVREVFRRARQAAPSVIFFDELDSIGGVRGIPTGSTGSNVQERVLAQLLTELDGMEALNNVTVIAATNRPDRIDPALLRPGRLDRIIYVPLPDYNTRKEIFCLQFKKTCVGNDVILNELVNKSENYSGAEIIAVCREAALKALEEDLNAEKVSRKHFIEAFSIVVPRTPKNLLEIYDKYLLK